MKIDGKKKFIFRKFSRKYIFFIFLIILIISILTYCSTTIIIEKQLKNSKGEKAYLITQEISDQINLIIKMRFQQLQAYAKEISQKDFLKQENQKFDLIKDKDTYINEKEFEYISSKNSNTSFISNLINNDLSKEIKEKFQYPRFYIENYGYEIFPEVIVTNKYGVNIAQTGKTSDYYQADEKWWRIAKEKGEYISDVCFDESTGKYSLEFAISLVNSSGNFLGVIKAVYNFKEIEELITKFKESKSSIESILLNSKEEIIYSTKNYSIFEQYPENLMNLQKREEDKKNNKNYFINKRKNLLIAYIPLSINLDSLNLNWIVLTETDFNESILLIKKIKKDILLISFFIAIFFLLINFYLLESITKPIEELTKANLKLQKGDFKTRVNIKTNDEFQTLGNIFNKTIKTLGQIDEERKRLDKAKTEFLSITSHELRSPMTPMRGQLQMLLEGYFGKLNKKQKESLNIILRNTERLDKIISDFLEVSRIEAARLKFEFKKINPVEITKRIIKEMQGFMPEKEIKIELKHDNIPIINADPNRLGQILRNLLNNAIKFTPKKGKITITCKMQKNMILFIVQDTGVGIKKSDQIRIFEPFYQADNMYQHKSGGTGLGLAIIKGIVEAQGGKIWVESKIGKGSKFYFTIPLKPVKEMKPIKLLFSEKTERNTRIKNLFIEELGPLGEKEFNNLEKTKGINKKTLIEYLNELKEKGILDDLKIAEFKKQILFIIEEKEGIKK